MQLDVNNPSGNENTAMKWSVHDT